MVVGGCGERSKYSAQQCIDIAVREFNMLDLSAIDFADGIDDDEEIALRGQVRRIQDAHPELVPFSECDTLLTPEDRQTIIAQLRPEIVQALIASAAPPTTPPTAPPG